MSQYNGEIFAYSWNFRDTANNGMIVECYGVNQNGESTILKIKDWKPYIYIEPIDEPNMSNENMHKIARTLTSSFRYIYKILVVRRHKLFYNHRTYNKEIDSWQEQKYPFLLVQCRLRKHIYTIDKTLSDKGSLFIPELGRVVKLKVHESSASPILQLVCRRELPTSGWIKFIGRKVQSTEKTTSCVHEYNVGDRDLKALSSNTVPPVNILSFDIEVNSTVWDRMPNAKEPEDRIFQISCVLGMTNSPTPTKNILLTLGEPSEMDPSIEVRSFTREGDLLRAFVNVIHETNPVIICGYNIFSFDIPYMVERSVMQNVYWDFVMQGVDKEPAKVKEIKWSSAAYKNQQFKYLDAHGRLFVDLLPVVQRDYRLENYRLKTVASHFLMETKDPLTVKGIFKCYQLGVVNASAHNATAKQKLVGSKALALCGKYCIQDSALVLSLFNKLGCWVGLSEMAKTCNVPIFDLYTKGQQIKVYSQVYKMCFEDDRVVQNDGYIANKDDKYTGAHVFEPIPGVYNRIVPFDFSSLYPTTIIAYNICYSTLVPWEDNRVSNDQCHVIEWEDHIGCEHDEVVRKTKIKSDDSYCRANRYRFLKEPKGIIPTLLENLLKARKETRSLQKTLDKKSVEWDILEKRQLSYKISANSVYGAFGTKVGYLPFLPGAQCVTALGRMNIQKAASYIQKEYNAKLVYGDTDSTYIQFPALLNCPHSDLWDFCLKVENEINNLFPKPMRLEFESVIYDRYLILCKKRYLCTKADRNGNIDSKLAIRGVLLTRRDNAHVIRNIYRQLIMNIFDQTPQEIVLYELVVGINSMFQRQVDLKDFVVTKSVNAIEDYKIRPLPDDPKKKAKRLADLDCTEDEYKLRALPGNAQLAEKMRRRGKPVMAGQRLEYVVVDPQRPTNKLIDKIEDVEYVIENGEYVTVDPLYYLKMMVPPFDEALSVGYGPKLTKFTEKIYKQHLQKFKLHQQLKELHSPVFIVI